MTIQEIYEAQDDTYRDHPSEDELVKLAASIVENDPESVLAFLVYDWAGHKLDKADAADDPDKKFRESVEQRLNAVASRIAAIERLNIQRGLEPMGIAVERLRDMMTTMVKEVQALKERVNRPVPVAPPVDNGFATTKSPFEEGGSITPFEVTSIVGESGYVAITGGTAHTFNGLANNANNAGMFVSVAKETDKEVAERVHAPGVGHSY